MLKLTREELETAFEKEIQKKLRNDKITEIIAKAILIGAIAAVIIAAVISSNLALWLLYSVLLIAVDIIVFFLIFIIVLSIDPTIKELGFRNTVKAIRYSRKYKDHIKHYCSEICSAALLKETDALILKEKNLFNRFQLLIMKTNIHCLRYEEIDARQAAAELEKIFDPKLHLHNELISAKLDIEDSFEHGDEVIRLIGELRDMKKSDDLNHLLHYLHLNAIECRFKGDYSEALENYLLRQEFFFRNKHELKSDIPKQINNNNIYNIAALYLDTATLLFEMGETERCRAVLRNSDRYIDGISCEIPELYTRVYESLTSKLAESGNLSENTAS